MATIESKITTHGLDYSTGVDEGNFDEVFATKANEKKALAERWNAIVDRLGVWGLDPNVTDEDGLVSPSKESCSSACKLVISMKNLGYALPTGVIPDGEGGITFENKQGPSYSRLEIDEDGLIMLLTFCDCKLLSQLNVEL